MKQGTVSFIFFVVISFFWNKESNYSTLPEFLFPFIHFFFCQHFLSQYGRKKNKLWPQNMASHHVLWLIVVIRFVEIFLWLFFLFFPSFFSENAWLTEWLCLLSLAVISKPFICLVKQNCTTTTTSTITFWSHIKNTVSTPTHSWLFEVCQPEFSENNC